MSNENLGGRPTKYKPEYCQQIIDYFNIKPYKKSKEITTFKDGNKKEKIILIPCDLPTIEGFAEKIDVNIDTLHEWKKKHKEFSDALGRAKALQKKILIVNGLKGLYQSNFAIFVTSNLTKFRQKTDIKNKININYSDKTKEVIDKIINAK